MWKSINGELIDVSILGNMCFEMSQLLIDNREFNYSPRKLLSEWDKVREPIDDYLKGK